jgi:hypothetical protein
MSYCVNCGVELDTTAEKCALCDTPVYNPTQKTEKDAHTPFSKTPLIPTNIRQKFIALIVTYIFLIPNIVCVLLNLLINPENLWFVYVLSSSLLCWIVFVFPFFTKKLHPYLMWGFDTVAVALYVFVFHANNFGGPKWYFHIALPTILICSICVVVFLYWIRQRKRHWTSIILHLFIDLVIILTILCICLYFAQKILTFNIFLVVDACCLALVFFWLYANKSKKLRSWLGKKMFV